MAGGDLGRRLAVAGVGIPFGLAVVYLGTWAVAPVLAVLAAMGTLEVFRMGEARGVRPFRWLGAVAASLAVLAAAWAPDLQTWGSFVTGLLLVLTLAALTAAVFFRGPEGGPLAAAGATVFAVVYVGVTLSFGVHLRAFPGVSEGGAGWEGAFLLIFALTVTWVGDSAAYFVGSRWGRRKLIPRVSPGKTVEGGIGGLLCSMLAGAVLGSLLLGSLNGLSLPATSAAALGLLIGGLAQVGDLAESLLKRDAGVKDSGALLPGHGGVLDRFDAVLFVLPVTYVLLPFLLR